MGIKYLPEVFKDITLNSPYKYLFIDLTTTCKEFLRIRSNVLFEEGDYIEIYINKTETHEMQNNDTKI
jgi:hypothetical protein